MNEATIQQLKGKYIKTLLQKVETLQVLDPALRKVILDTVNDFVRELLVEIIREPFNDKKEERSNISSKYTYTPNSH